MGFYGKLFVRGYTVKKKIITALSIVLFTSLGLFIYFEFVPPLVISGFGETDNQKAIY